MTSTPPQKHQFYSSLRRSVISEAKRDIYHVVDDVTIMKIALQNKIHFYIKPDQ